MMAGSQSVLSSPEDSDCTDAGGGGSDGGGGLGGSGERDGGGGDGRGGGGAAPEIDWRGGTLSFLPNFHVMGFTNNWLFNALCRCPAHVHADCAAAPLTVERAPVSGPCRG